MPSLPAMEVDGEEAEDVSTEALVLPTIGTLLATGAVAGMVCRAPDRPYGSWAALLAHAVGFLLLAAVVHVAAIRLIMTVYRDHLRAPVQVLLRGTWMCAALLPVAVLLAHAGSEWAAVVLPVILVAAVRFVRRVSPTAGRVAHAAAPAGVAEGLFAGAVQPPSLLRTMCPLVLVAVLLEMGAVMVASWQFALAGLLLGLALAMMLWRTPLRARAAVSAWSVRRVEGETVAALLLLLLTLLPSLGGSRMAGRMGRLLGIAAVARHQAPPPPVVAGGARGGTLSGVILTLPPKPREKLLPPPPRQTMAVATGARRRVQVIPFDGAYWYFRSPELQPRPDARRVKGDPMKVAIRSTDTVALQMEAHQRLGEPLGTDCCAAIRVAVQVADDGGGPIELELVLEGRGWKQSLGTLPVRSNGAVLEFALPKGMATRWFDELTVVVKRMGMRSRAGTRLAVERFELVGG